MDTKTQETPCPSPLIVNKEEQRQTTKLFWILNLGWWILNLVQAGFMELANDEAYYWMFSKHLDWGYFDHPPMIAVFIFLGQFLNGEIGVRLISTLAQPIFLYLLWKMIAPADAKRQSIYLFFAIAFAMPILHIYGVVAVPDAPLMLFSTLFIYLFIRYIKHEQWLDVLLMGLTIAAIGYSKYTGVLVVIFAVLAHPKILLKKGIYIAAFIAFLLLLPHLYWQYTHDWVSFKYHLIGRSSDFKWNFLWFYLLGFIGVFNPFLFPVFVRNGFSKINKTLGMRLLWLISIFFFLFFLFSCRKNNIQPQWFLPVVLAVMALVWHAAENSIKIRKYVLWIAVFTGVLMLFFRMELIFNHFHLKSEFFNNKTACRELADMAEGKPIIFYGNYGLASKYHFYAKQEAIAYPNIYCRANQYLFWNNEDPWAGQTVIVEGNFGELSTNKPLSNGYIFCYQIDSAYFSIKNIEISALNTIPETIYEGDSLFFYLKIKNPYPYTVELPDVRFFLSLPWISCRSYILSDLPIVMAPKSEIQMQTSVCINNLEDFETQHAKAGFVIIRPFKSHWFNSKTVTVKTAIKNNNNK